jgi:hypothetical protein
MDAPDKIWLQPECCARHSEFGRLWCDKDDFGCEDNAPGVEYTRTSAHPVTVEMLDEQLAQAFAEQGRLQHQLDAAEANINLKADFIEKTMNQLAEAEQKLDAANARADAAAPPDVAQAARVLLDALGDYTNNRRHLAFEAAMIGQRDSNKPAPFNQIGDGLIAALRAIVDGGAE